MEYPVMFIETNITLHDFIFIVQAYPREGKKADSFMIRYKLNGRGYKIHYHGKFTRREIKAIVMHFTADTTILELFNERFKEMKDKAKEILI